MLAQIISIKVLSQNWNVFRLETKFPKVNQFLNPTVLDPILETKSVLEDFSNKNLFA